MLEKTEGIVLKTIKYGESSLIVKLFTEKFGLISILFKGVRNSRNKDAHILQLGNILDIHIYYKENKNILLSKEKSLQYLYQNMMQNMSKLTIVYFAIEVMLHCTKEYQINKEEYYFLKNFLLQLDAEQESVENYPILFLYQLSNVLGFKPSCNAPDQQKYFNLERGVYEELPQPNLHADADSSKLLYTMLINLDSNIDIQFTNQQRKKLIETWIKYYQYQIPEFKPLQTPNILHQLLKA